ncbi:gamma-glutamylcyclotransferase family protein [Ferruginivarius sediminum]|uniref:Putative gamma-glutamylcyclotransferase n=1 Tax=Ferruginivarius sediminum TaxID=2661937 RepID=A0A369TFD1_9PROT|nr:gamma-glutamylcyclotransferase family protein [Ferruginivarius sediminum]RDD62827.1 gamma-glutamylcyclotransferase [Ferruginivarius sediminum]
MLFFFYGTLMDDELRGALAGAKDATLRITPGTLLNHRRCRARFGNYPVVIPQPGGRLSGLFVEGVDAHLALWIAHYEGPGYVPARVSAVDHAGQRLRPWAFMPLTRQDASREPWDLQAWQRHDKPAVRRLMQNWLLHVDGGRPLALDAPWLSRRRLWAAVRLGNDQPRPNPHLGLTGCSPIHADDEGLGAAAE